MAARSFVFPVLELEEDESLGERVNQLVKLSENFLIPQAFIIKPEAYLEFLTFNKLNKKIKHLLNSLDEGSAKSKMEVRNHIKKYLEQSVIPERIVKEILKEYQKIGGIFHHGEVSVSLSFANNNVSPIKVKGDAALLNVIKSLWIKLFPSGLLENPAIIVSKNEKGKKGKIRTSSKLIRSKYDFTSKEKEKLEELVKRFKKEFYLPYEINFLMRNNTTYILGIVPETQIEKEIFPETNYTIVSNSLGKRNSQILS